ncbi:MAG: aconitate hydratase [Oscillospiraceae bacterium]|nr:aconitate hydratase [Oscillospiraceae bacterium]
MGQTIAQKIIAAHLMDGEAKAGAEVGLRIDQTLTQDATGTMAYLEYEAMGIPRVKTELSVAYIDHNTLQNGFMNADDHRFIRTICKKIGVRYSRPGNGICHQVHLERFAKPGKTLIGSDSHTPTAGGIGSLAIGAGGLDVAVAMGGGAYYIPYPKIVHIVLKGALRPMVSAKDIILEVLRLLSVKGGVGKIVEYGGEGVASLSVPQRATITNMGAELGATTSIFPSDEVTRAFLRAQGREEDYIPLDADPDAAYDEELVINLSSLQPLAACPHMPDNVKPVKELGLMKVDQVCIGSCTNSSYTDLMTVAAMLKGKTVDPTVSLAIAPGSRQVLTMLSKNGALADLIAAGARILESACGPCIGMGQSPNSAGVSLRTFNRNFEGRSGTKDAGVYLVSPETAAAACLSGYITDPTTLPPVAPVEMPSQFEINDNMIDLPASEAEYEKVEILRGPNIKPLPKAAELSNVVSLPCLLKVGDNITTDHIMPAGSKILPYRSNIPHLANFCFEVCDPEFPARALAADGGFIVGGANYGQGSSREHAALVPLYLGIRAVIAVSFARIHKANLVNAGILPLEFADPADYEKISLGDELELTGILDGVENGSIRLTNKANGETFPLQCAISARQAAVIKSGGLLNYTREQNK